MRTLLLTCGFAVVMGCSTATDTAVTPPVTGSEDTVTVETPAAPTASGSEGTEITLSPENTYIQFVGTHVGPTPDPKARTGKFTDFSGVARVEDDDLKSVVVDIKTDSLETSIENLTNHLKSEDFFDVRNYPTARFESTSITRNEDGEHIITGNLTLLGQTNEISFPASVGMPDGEFQLSAKVKLDRTEFGMTSNTDKVNKEVNLTIGSGDSTHAPEDDQASRNDE